MNLLDRARIETAVQSYDFWLELRGARARRRRELRRELRANLIAAAERVGAQEAVARIGSTRQMAAEAIAVPAHRPRWYHGLLAALVGLFVTSILELFAGIYWIEGAMAAAPESSTSGSLMLFLGSRVYYEVFDDGGFEFGVTPGWLSLAVALVAFILVARPWRVFTGRRHLAAQPRPA